jgi:hypothetical protein
MNEVKYQEEDATLPKEEENVDTDIHFQLFS